MMPNVKKNIIIKLVASDQATFSNRNACIHIYKRNGEIKWAFFKSSSRDAGSFAVENYQINAFNPCHHSNVYVVHVPVCTGKPMPKPYAINLRKTTMELTKSKRNNTKLSQMKTKWIHTETSNYSYAKWSDWLESAVWIARGLDKDSEICRTYMRKTDRQTESETFCGRASKNSSNDQMWMDTLSSIHRLS